MFTATDRWLPTPNSRHPHHAKWTSFLLYGPRLSVCRTVFILKIYILIALYRSLSLSADATCRQMQTQFRCQQRSPCSSHLTHHSIWRHICLIPCLIRKASSRILLCSPNLLSHLLTDCFASRRKNPMKNPDLHELWCVPSGISKLRFVTSC